VPKTAQPKLEKERFLEVRSSGNAIKAVEADGDAQGSATTRAASTASIATYPEDRLAGEIHDEGPQRDKPKFAIAADRPDLVETAEAEAVDGGNVEERQQQSQQGVERRRYRGLQYGMPNLAPLDIFK
jgi:hypothetical protein